MLLFHFRGVMTKSEGDRGVQRALLARIKRAGALAAQQKKDEQSLDIKEDGQKADEAEVPTSLWDEMWLLSRRDCGFPPFAAEDKGRPLDIDEDSGLERWRWALEAFRNIWLIRRWRRNVARSLCSFLRITRNRRHVEQMVFWRSRRRGRPGEGYVWSARGKAEYKRHWMEWRASKEREKMLASGVEALGRALEATWWDWDWGSSLFFWRWPDSHILWARDGQPHFVTGELPQTKEPQRRAATDEDQQKMNKKVNKVRKRRYICTGYVSCLTNMFFVKKGKVDIRMIYDGTKSGLNSCLFAPHFSLPVMAHTLRSLMEGYYSADLDVGEMFLNWWMGLDMRP